MDEQDIKAVQLCLDMVTDTTVETNGHYGHYTERIVKIYQEKNGIIPCDGVVDHILWEKMKSTCSHLFYNISYN